MAREVETVTVADEGRAALTPSSEGNVRHVVLVNGFPIVLRNPPGTPVWVPPVAESKHGTQS
jgi:hypothetical protein